MERVIFSDNGVLIDYTNELNCFTSKTALINFTLNEDYLYIGSDLPFNNKYFQVATPNEQNATIFIEYWDGNKWVAAIDVIDETKINNKSLAKSGHIQWSYDANQSTMSADDTKDIAALSSLKINSLFWLRISFTASLSNLTALKFIGQKFSEDEDLAIFYPEMSLANTKAQFTSNKTDWNDQHFIAAEHICRKLKVDGIIKHPNQILNWRIFTEASVHKVAEMIYLAFGDDFNDNRKIALEYYNQAMKNVINQIDLNNNAVLDSHEKFFRSGFMTR